MDDSLYSALLDQLAEMPVFLRRTLAGLPREALLRMPQNDKSHLLEHLWHTRDCETDLYGLRIRQMPPFGNMHVKITVDPRTDRELEVFAQLGKGGDVATSDLEAICRMISLWLRAGGS